jgi:putative endonuclease
MRRTVEDRRRARSWGLLAEALASAVLVSKGYTILSRRFHVKGGEIDIVARRGETIVFVEVKARATLVEAQTAIGRVKRQRISRAARVWLAANPWAARLTLRGDAISLAPWRWPSHVIGAVELDIG